MSRKPNVLWIIMDDCRADALGCYGKPWAKTPHMDALARNGVQFQTAVIQNVVCAPCRTSMITGEYPHTTGVMNMGAAPDVPAPYLKHEADLAPKDKTLPENLLNAWTGAGIPLMNIGKLNCYAHDKYWIQLQSEKSNVDQFDVFGLTNNPETISRLEQSGTTYPALVTENHRWAIGGTLPFEPEEMTTWKLGDLAVSKIRELTQSANSFFLKVAFHAPHVPWRVPLSYMIDPATIDLPLPTGEELNSKPCFEQKNLRTYSGSLNHSREDIDLARGTYYGMVTLVDDQVGRIVTALREAGQLEDTIIAITSDQGVQLAEHGLWKKECMYDQNVCVPLILSMPGTLPAKLIDEPVELVDFIPTLMELSGFDVPEDIGGKSLMPLIRGDVDSWRPACFCEHDHSMGAYDELREGGGRRVMVRTKDWKLIYFMDDRVADKDGALYDLINDPWEKINLYNDSKYSDTITELEHFAETWT